MIIFINAYRTKPDEFNKRLEKVEEINKPAPVTGDSKEREFSMPTRPKSDLSSQTSMKKEKVWSNIPAQFFVHVSLFEKSISRTR